MAAQPQHAQIHLGPGRRVTLYYENAPAERIEPLTIEECRNLVVELLDQRPAAPHSATVFVSAEDDPGVDSGLLESELQELGVDCRKTLVNRGGYGPEWLVEGLPDQALVAGLAGIAKITFVDHIEPYEVHQRWLIDGGQLTLAIWARDDGIVSLDDPNCEPQRSQWLERAHAPIVKILERRWPVLQDSAADALERVARLAREEPDVDAVLERMDRSDLIPFIEEVDRKLADPIDELRWAGEPWPELRETFSRLHALLCDPNQYRDSIQVEKGTLTLTEAADAAALLRYGRMLGKVFLHDEALRMTQQLGRKFAHHRSPAG